MARQALRVPSDDKTRQSSVKGEIIKTSTGASVNSSSGKRRVVVLTTTQMLSSSSPRKGVGTCVLMHHSNAS